MVSWREINEAIARCRRSSNIVACLTALFERNKDGHVAAALAEEYERLGKIEDARRWFTEASCLYPKPEYKARAQSALRRLGSSVQPASSETPPAQVSVLHIIECSKRKIWSLGAPSTPRFVPAKQAYLGDAITSWLADLRASEERWLILSARYGFIDPDQPIENYDVSFKLPATGPITDDALAAQVRYQVRWLDAVPIRQFTRVVVHGHNDYFDRVRLAFSAVGARVLRDDGRIEVVDGRAANLLPTIMSVLPQKAVTQPFSATSAFSWSTERANAIGLALRELPAKVFVNFDKSEPEWPVVERLGTWPDRPLASLAAICLGITDYQLGAGAAAGYWKAVTMELDRRAPSLATDVIELMARAVAEAAGGLQLLRVDSLAWQLAEGAGTSEWESLVTQRLIDAGSPSDTASQLALEFNWTAHGRVGVS